MRVREAIVDATDNDLQPPWKFFSLFIAEYLSFSFLYSGVQTLEVDKESVIKMSSFY